MTMDTDLEGLEFMDNLDDEIDAELEEGTSAEALMAILFVAISDLLIGELEMGLAEAKAELVKMAEGASERLWLRVDPGLMH